MDTSTDDLAVRVNALLVGALGPLAGDGAATGIDKRAVSEPR